MEISVIFYLLRSNHSLNRNKQCKNGKQPAYIKSVLMTSVILEGQWDITV